MPAPAAHAAYLARAGDPYRAAHALVSKAVRSVFPKARAVVEHRMPAWKIPRPKDAPRPGVAGTIDPDTVFVGLVERAHGITLHLWYPGDYHLFDKHASALKEAGFKVMRGCLVFNRKAGFPAAAVHRLLQAIRAADGQKAKPARKR